MITAKIIADNVSAYTGTRITTFELEYPRFIHAELMTHRQFSRNSSSSRAIPIDKMIEQLETNMAMPIHWGLNQSGMQAKDEEANVIECQNTWLKARDRAIQSARELQALGLHKQIVNRVLEPFQMMKVLVTSTSYDNFLNLRLHKDAQPEIRHLAKLMYQNLQASVPIPLSQGHWHLPYVDFCLDKNNQQQFYVDDKPVDLDTAIKVSCSCAAQVSYRKNDTSIEKAIAIYDKLVNSEPVHASAFEHCATPIDVDTVYEIEEVPDGMSGIRFGDENSDHSMFSGNFDNWIQYRQLIPNHDCKQFNYEIIP